MSKPYVFRDEQAETDAFVELMGGVYRADRIFALYKNCYPTQNWRCETVNTEDVFRRTAPNHGFTQKEIEALLALQ